jgi:long-chain acyl-CoA synthetase
MSGRTLYRMFHETVQAHGSARAVGYKPTKTASDYTYLTYAELNARVCELARGLAALGLKRGDALALVMENRLEWTMSDLAAQLLGLVLVSPYATLPAPQIAYILRDSRAKAILFSDAKQKAKVLSIKDDCSDLQHLIALEGEPEHLEHEGVLPFAELLEQGKASGMSDVELEKLSREVDPNAVATLIYTSGTTGDPKGAMLSHTNILQTPDAVVEEPVADLGTSDVFLSFLPLSHITERVGGHYLPLRVGACIVYSQGLASLGEEITKTVRPTCLLCVPRLFENMYEKFQDALAKREGRKKQIAEWAIRVGIEIAERRSAGKSPGLLLSLQRVVADRLALSKIREAVTGGNLRFVVSGGAPLDHKIAAFFLGIGIEILEGYGLSETNIIAINRPARQRIGTVGSIMPRCEVKIADDGEILMRGQGKMLGYLNKPDATAEAIDADGWFHTGDIGELSGDKYLKITDRKKDLIVLTNGKKVAPQPIEAELKHSPYIAEAVLFGDKQATVMALLVPAFDKLLAWAKSQELPTNDIEALLANSAVQKLYRGEIDRLTPHLADYEKIKRFKMIGKPFGIDSGELTPTLKVKRKFVAEKYADLLASMAR